MIKYKYNLILLNLMHSTKERKLYVHFVQKNNNIIINVSSNIWNKLICNQTNF